MTERNVRQLEQDQKVPLSYIGKVSVWTTLPATA